MERFSINIDNLKLETLLECILQESKFATKNKIKDFYTCKGEPKNYMKEVVQDINESEIVYYKDESFNVLNGDTGICFIFHNGYVYSFDEYYQDCPIFANILKN